jgi:hypothetical protein
VVRKASGPPRAHIIRHPVTQSHGASGSRHVVRAPIRRCYMRFASETTDEGYPEGPQYLLPGFGRRNTTG